MKIKNGPKSSSSRARSKTPQRRTMNEATNAATGNFNSWLKHTAKLTPAEITLVLKICNSENIDGVEGMRELHDSGQLEQRFSHTDKLPGIRLMYAHWKISHALDGLPPPEHTFNGSKGFKTSTTTFAAVLLFLVAAAFVLGSRSSDQIKLARTMPTTSEAITAGTLTTPGHVGGSG